MAVFAPIPSAMMATATHANPGLFINSLIANFRVRMSAVIFGTSIHQWLEQFSDQFYCAQSHLASISLQGSSKVTCPLFDTGVQ
jgi:hypothetical protein